MDEGDTADLSARDIDAQIQGEREGEVAIYTCPVCGGSLWQEAAEDAPGFRCHLGHAFSAGALAREQAAKLGVALWVAVRTLNDQANLYRQLARKAWQQERKEAATLWEDQARALDDHSATIQRLLESAATPADTSQE
jgi:two-component system, chemotaxis family, protein-glutamate methylesterase/glutaminase